MHIDIKIIKGFCLHPHLPSSTLSGNASKSAVQTYTLSVIRLIVAVSDHRRTGSRNSHGVRLPNLQQVSISGHSRFKAQSAAQNRKLGYQCRMYNLPAHSHSTWQSQWTYPAFAARQDLEFAAAVPRRPECLRDNKSRLVTST